MQRKALALSAERKILRAVLNKAELAAEQRNRRQAAKALSREIGAGRSAAEQSVQRWLEWRRRHPERTPTAEESARKWLAFREAQKLGVRTPDLSRGGNSHDRDELGRRHKTRELTHDYGLEL
jgi:hypothetical protein